MYLWVHWNKTSSFCQKIIIFWMMEKSDWKQWFDEYFFVNKR